jgi:hypothetical protein
MTRSHQAILIKSPSHLSDEYILRIIATAIVVVFCQVAEAADLKLRIVWEGALPDVPRIENPFSHDCRDVDLNADRQFVDVETRGVRDAVVYVAPLRRDRGRWQQLRRNETVRVEVKDCRIHPHIVVARAGDKLHVVHRDESATHNLNFSCFANPPLGATIPAHGEHTRELRSAEPAAVPIKCNIHPWEKAYLFVLDHSYIGVSGREGELAIRGLPAETEVPLRFFHEHGSIHSVRIDGQRQPLENGRLTVRVAGPVTNLGDVVINTDSFTQPDSENE